MFSRDSERDWETVRERERGREGKSMWVCVYERDLQEGANCVCRGFYGVIVVGGEGESGSRGIERKRGSAFESVFKGLYLRVAATPEQVL